MGRKSTIQNGRNNNKEREFEAKLKLQKVKLSPLFDIHVAPKKKRPKSRLSKKKKKS